MHYRSLLQLTSSVLFLLILLSSELALTATVPFVPRWPYNSPDNHDYRSFTNGTMTVNVNTSEVPFTTWSNAKYQGNQDFTVTVDFNNYTTQGTITNPSAGLHSDAHLSIRWSIDEQTAQEIDIRRSSYNEGGEEFETNYSTSTPTNWVPNQRFSTPSSITSGKFSISKAGNSVTVSVKDSSNNPLHTWTFDSITTFSQRSDISVNLRTINGPRERTSVEFANLDMNPVPVDINWTNVRNHKREGVDQGNRLAFTILDTSGNLITTDVVDTVQLFDPLETPIILASDGYYLMEKYLPGRYDAPTGRWIYNDSFTQDSGYSSTFTGALITGDYHLIITTTSGLVYHRYINFPGFKTLPFISSDSFYAYKDASGNLLWSWKNPYDASFIAAQLNTALRAWIDVYQNSVLKAEIWVSAPTHIGHIFVPANIVQLYEAAGTEYTIAVQLRMTDNSNRAYSKQVPLVLAQGPPLSGDVDGNGKVNLVEAINALKVAAGQQ